VQNAWQPTCRVEYLRLRAQILRQIREFFLARNVLEVETPILGHACGTDPHLDFLLVYYDLGYKQEQLFLQTSPEFAMKRLLCAGSGSIFQIAKAFRNGESGRFHNPEFTMLEWYRVDYNLADLMQEVVELLNFLSAEHLTLEPTQQFSYQEIFIRLTGLDPLGFPMMNIVLLHHRRINQKP